MVSRGGIYREGIYRGEIFRGGIFRGGIYREEGYIEGGVIRARMRILCVTTRGLSSCIGHLVGVPVISKGARSSPRGPGHLPVLIGTIVLALYVELLD